MRVTRVARLTNSISENGAHLGCISPKKHERPPSRRPFAFISNCPATTYQNDPGGSRTRDLRIKRKTEFHTARSPEYLEVCASSHLNARRCSLAVLRVLGRSLYVARQMGCNAGATGVIRAKWCYRGSPVCSNTPNSSMAPR